MRVRVTIELDVDPDAWVAAATEEEEWWLIDGEDANDPTNLLAVADAATSYIDAEDNLPRWARDAVSIVGQSLSIVEPS